MIIILFPVYIRVVVDAAAAAAASPAARTVVALEDTPGWCSASAARSKICDNGEVKMLAEIVEGGMATALGSGAARCGAVRQVDKHAKKCRLSCCFFYEILHLGHHC